ncbi:DUF3027 domain-containing protein [Micromonospora sp. NPDC094482]|uniref:DUF3027 domain-containing protein n=1 Tax=unclassified Micromonospora TaxID=2617518 RepID=UPI00332B05A1
MAQGKPWTGNDADHNNHCHQRWIKQRNRDTVDPAYPEAWYDEQCGGCRFWIPLDGELGHDYGACTNPASPFDGRVRFEHDGCAAFANRDDGSFG